MSDPRAFIQLKIDRLLSVIRAATPEQALQSAQAVAKGGIHLIEVTFTVPDATRVMRELAGLDGVVMGAGTVLHPDQARAALDAGAQFIVAPNLSLEVAKVAHAAGVMYCPGAYTTGEIIAARDAGAHVVKVYPVGVAGGPQYIQIIRDPLPDIPMLAAGGTTMENFIPFLRAGCHGIGLAGALADPKLAANGQFGEITTRAKAFVGRLREARAVGQVAEIA